MQGPQGQHRHHDPPDGAPAPRALAHLRPSDAAGAGWLALAVALTATGMVLATRDGWVAWAAGQAVLALAFVQWFAILHEAGHGVLFRSRVANVVAGITAGAMALIPFGVWRRVHQRHHRWTGWQDLDPTTAALVPRPLGRLERLAANVCWRCWLPLFAVLYRLNNFWHAPRLARLFPARAVHRRLWLWLAAHVAGYTALAVAVGPVALAWTVGPALTLAFVAEDVLLVSQHTHLPMERSGGRRVAPFPSIAQQTFTRSLRLPPVLSWLLLHVDAHELHHMYPAVPGYRLHRVPWTPSNEVSWRRWIPAARAVPGEVLLFQNRLESGFDV